MKGNVKSLNYYIDKPIEELMEECGAFFAFSDKQYEEKAVEGIKYVSLVNGLIIPKDNVESFLKRYTAINEEGVAKRVEDSSIKDIIWYELGNYEVQLTGDLTDVIEALEGYPITEEQIENEYVEYFQMCLDNDYF